MMSEKMFELAGGLVSPAIAAADAMHLSVHKSLKVEHFDFCNDNRKTCY